MAMIRTICRRGVVVPLALRAVATFSSSSSFLMAASGCDHHDHVNKNVPIFKGDNKHGRFNFSTTAAGHRKKIADQDFIKHIKSEINLVERPIKLPEAPVDFPFEIKDNPGDMSRFVLVREFCGENIEVEVTMLPDSCYYCDDDSDTSDLDHDDYISEETFELHVKISKENGKVLECVVWANNGCIQVQNVCIDKLDIRYHPVYWMKEDRQKSWKDFLALRGIEDGVFVDFLIKYMCKRGDRDHLLFFKKIKKFVK